jgi:Pyruvate/2-oxoacid:ferredoxin oxidoreductase delta subunit
VRAEDVLLGLAALAPAKCKLQLTVRHDDAEAALQAAAERLQAQVEVVRLPDAWPPASGPPDAGAPRPDASAPWPDARALVAASPRRRDGARYVTVAGAVREPAVLPVRGEIAVADLVAGAAPLDDDWLPLTFDAGIELGEREAMWGGEPLLLVLPARHPLVRKCKTPLTDWLARAASACEGCRICSEACGHLQPHELVWTLSTLRDDGMAPLAALACTGCGLCDAVCPSALSPRALVVDVRDRLRAMGANVSDSLRKESGANVSDSLRKAAPGLDVKLLTQRLGLADYDREPLRKLS